MFVKAFASLFLFLFVNITFLPVYKSLLEKKETIDLLDLVAEEEKQGESKSLMEMDKVYLCVNDIYSSGLFFIIDLKYQDIFSVILHCHPEKVSPPPKS